MVLPVFVYFVGTSELRFQMLADCLPVTFLFNEYHFVTGVLFAIVEGRMLEL